MNTPSTPPDLPPSDEVFDRIHRSRLVPVIRVRDASTALELVDRLLAAGIDVVEITTTIDGWDEVIKQLRQTHPDVCAGAGTVTTSELAERAVAVGAQFCVSPCLVPEARRALEATDVPMLEGGFTPTEVLGAAKRGVAKLFPAHLGGIKYLDSLLAVAPDARIMPTGGIPLNEASSWLATGAFAVGIGSDLTAPGDIATRVREALTVPNQLSPKG
jgi:2-dehydro-3-deoxyphosphogluconate aldolase / (4S)-4-hydroxy-2-oxoglutarate aldolase